MDMKLDKIGLGVINEKFDDEFLRVVNNILDPNTEANKAREINIKFKIKPDKENREMCSMEAIVTSKLAPTHAHISRVVMGIDPRTGECNAQELMEGNLFRTPVDSEKITPINEAAN